VSITGRKGKKKVRKNKKVKHLDVVDFDINLFSKIKLTSSKVVLYKYPLITITPYKRYRIGWWKSYNLIKHNRVGNYSKATLKNTLNALAGLFLILVRYKDEEFSKALFRYDFLETGLVPEFVHAERIREPWQFWYDSELFGTHEIVKNIPDNIEDINPALTSPKFTKFFGRFNP